MRQPLRPTSEAAARPLNGLQVLITRPRRQGSSLRDRLTGLGAEVHHVPLIETEPVENWDAVDSAIRSLQKYSGLIITSTNGMKYWWDRLHQQHTDQVQAARRLDVFVVGRKSGTFVRRLGFRPTVIPGVVDSRTLAQELAGRCSAGSRYLHPTGDLAGAELSTILRGHRIAVDDLIVYRTLKANPAALTELRELFKTRSIDIVTVFSPSAVEVLADAVPAEELRKVTVAAIGGTTARAVEAASLKTHIVADTPSAESLVAAIQRHIRHRG